MHEQQGSWEKECWADLLLLHGTCKVLVEAGQGRPLDIQCLSHCALAPAGGCICF